MLGLHQLSVTNIKSGFVSLAMQPTSIFFTILCAFKYKIFSVSWVAPPGALPLRWDSSLSSCSFSPPPPSLSPSLSPSPCLSPWLTPFGLVVFPPVSLVLASVHCSSHRRWYPHTPSLLFSLSFPPSLSLILGGSARGKIRIRIK